MGNKLDHTWVISCDFGEKHTRMMTGLVIDKGENYYATIGKTYDEIIDLLGDSGGIYDPDGKPDNKNYYLHYTIRYDDWNGYEVILLHFKDDALTKVEKEQLAYL